MNTSQNHHDPSATLGSAEAVELADYLSQLVKAGLPLAEGLRAVADDTRSTRLKGTLRALAEQLQAGQSLESALESLSTRLPSHIRDLVIAGVRSGRLGETLEQVLAHERQMDDLSAQFWQAISYPVTLLTFLSAWLLFVTWWLIPQMELKELYDGFMTVMPAMTRNLLDFAKAVPPMLLTVLLSVVIVIGVARIFRGRELLSRLMTQLPLLGPAWWYRGLFEFSGLLAVFLEQRLSLPEALRLASQSARDPAVRRACQIAAREVADGRPLSKSMTAQSYFPATVVNLVEWGERHSALADSLLGARQMMAERFELQIQLMRSVLPPIAFLIVAGTALFVANGVLGNLIKLITDLS